MRPALAHKQAGQTSFGLGFVLALGAFAAAQAAALQGYVARGTATVQTARGAESGTITVEVWDAAHCRVTLDISRPDERRVLTAVLDGKRTQVSGPRGLVKALIGPDPVHGCALLPLGGEPADLSWQTAAGSVQIAYTGYTAEGYPVQVSESVAGAPRLAVSFTSLSPHDFTEADFALKPPPLPATNGYPGGGE